MNFISYAQNFEDIMLKRVLNDVEKGFYIDVGAAWPDEDSVTKAFYDAGWSGINIEPNPVFHSMLEQQRVRDVNLRIAIGDHADEIEMYFIAGTGLSSGDASVAEMHARSGYQSERQLVKMDTLASVWATHVPPGQEVHFLKVDVEGLELQVLRGHDWKTKRPWIVLVEATLPMSRAEAHEGWEPVLLEGGYQFAYADGLNRFYVASERASLCEGFKYPPNVFDRFTRIAEKVAEDEARALKAQVERLDTKNQRSAARIQRLEVRVQQAESRAQQAQADVVRLSYELQVVYASSSWKVTQPFRWATTLLRRIASRLRGRSAPHLIDKTVSDDLASPGNALSPRAKQIYTTMHVAAHSHEGKDDAHRH
ncbi:FkbM family methyltransferase [Herbaspirillum rubrisubalbicans]|uniref:FkbM family methyltransferase n=1 Tax=Herbaspirillum rubrisubalbicans TaxID=80842 RepID=UPI00209F0C3D|nr:FkbM family methyltransferase [Herbaspirillum rubrisubalbicans]MCP1575833.1 FkbM family methyltransferase [Herbaspirillum rubrisubalbicans]